MLNGNANRVLAYRNLYRHGLQAVQYSKPARYVLRDILREAFGKSPATEYQAKRIGNTILFLQNAAKSKGMEHKIVKNLIFVRWSQRKNIEYNAL